MIASGGPFEARDVSLTTSARSRKRFSGKALNSPVSNWIFEPVSI